jgi:hypothetical protein
MITNRFIPLRPFVAINLCGLIFVREGQRFDATCLRHEHIHTCQMKELLFVGFYLIYIIEWLVRLLLRRGNAMDAYRFISFEREAYAHQHDASYLSRRRHYAWLAYVCYRRQNGHSAQK